MNPVLEGGEGRWTHLKVITLLNKKVQFVLQFLQHRPLQKGLPLAKRLQTMRLPGDPHIQIHTNTKERGDTLNNTGEKSTMFKENKLYTSKYWYS